MMHALTIQQPWAEAIARHGKDVENRTRRPPAHLLGQRIAIHVSQSWDAWDAICADGLESSDHPKLPPALLDWMDVAEVGGKAPPPNAGRIIATARLIGWNRYGHDHSKEALAKRKGPCCYNGVTDDDSYREAPNSPWFVGPVGWVLADVRALAEPVGQKCSGCNGTGCPAFVDKCGICDGSGALPIRGQVYPFALSAEVEAAVLRQEAPHV